MKTQIIAEAASNHGGDIEIAKQMIRAAKACGADYIKFQSWQAKNLRPDDPAKESFAKKELSDEDHRILINECKKAGIKFLTSCFDWKRVDFLAALGLKTIKVPSTELTSARMLNMLREKFDHIILSTGASSKEEIEQAVELLKKGKFTLLHCVSEYPTPLERVNLARMNWLKKFTADVGFSDHTIGTTAAKLAILEGATYIEKHFTLKIDPANVFSKVCMDAKGLKEICNFAKKPDASKIQNYAELKKIATGVELVEMSLEEEKVRKQYVGRWGDNT